LVLYSSCIPQQLQKKVLLIKIRSTFRENRVNIFYLEILGLNVISYKIKQVLISFVGSDSWLSIKHPFNASLWLKNKFYTNVNNNREKYSDK